jgi:FixJ family two-component response regulator
MDETAPTVFVVDDDVNVRGALARLIRSLGMQVATFASAREFRACQRPDGPACLVLDMRLAGENGLMVQEAMRTAAWRPPIIFLTGHGTIPMCVRAMKAGAVDFLQKPFDDQELLACVQRALETSRAQRAERAERAMLGERMASLTPREREVLRLVVTGMLNKQIADKLDIAEKTVKVHRGRVMEKMLAGSVADLVRMTAKLGDGATIR